MVQTHAKRHTVGCIYISDPTTCGMLCALFASASSVSQMIVHHHDGSLTDVHKAGFRPG